MANKIVTTKVFEKSLLAANKHCKKKGSVAYKFMSDAIDEKVAREKYNAPTSLSEAVFVALGEASMCWSERPKGEFNSTDAKRIGEELLFQISKLTGIEKS